MTNHLHRTALTCGPLVYLRTLKCASTFFWQSFTKFGWVEIEFDKIDWQKQQVFSHIMHPTQRRLKGISEFIWINQTQDLLITDSDYKKFIQQTVILDQHTVSYYDNFGDRCELIDWIPLIPNLTHQQVADLTSLMLFEHGIKIFNRWKWEWQHISNPTKKQIHQQVVDCVNSATDLSEINHYLHRDLRLYQQVIDRFNNTGKTWAEVSWLRQQ